ncbi:YqaJ viral recombinase family nuclease [Vibrio penaeicida]|uniref:YqaJ viral recombinase domain-containing protein n=1 Tax=Vibrio penaeicida TaxID=104609 RepID=A0AAV5NPY8_9VIBR|nr:YqaJ viral recombinase family protein [Vibrio penaeicida]GLQ72697.1 hypothetical protein GCM10007932_20570 [Vibrio penaeicida]
MTTANAVSLASIHKEYVKSLIILARRNGMKQTDIESFHFQRRFGVGGSDVAAILGICPYRTPHDVWLEKTGREEPEDLSNNDRVHFGIELEETVAREYTRRTGLKVQKRNSPYIHKTMPWLRANIDRHIVGAKKGLECKTADKWASRDLWGNGNAYMEKNGVIECVEESDEVPETYMLQMLHYMMVCDKKVWDLAVLIGGNDFRIYTMLYDNHLADIVTQKLKVFWFEHVIADIPPSPLNLHDLDTMHAKDNGRSIVVTDEILDVFKRFKTIKDQIKALETEAYGPMVGGKHIGGLDFAIKHFMGDNAEVLLDENGKKLCSWKSQSSKRVDTTALKEAEPAIAKQFTTESHSRVFRA